MRVEEIDIDQLTSNPRNPNKHSPEQIKRLSELIQYQGWRLPIIVSKQSGFIVSGHGRLEAAKLLGLKKVPVTYQDFLDDTQEYAFLVSDNAIASWAELDLSSINSFVPDLGPDFSIDLLGFKTFTIDAFENKDLIEEVNKGDENSEWVGMPDFQYKDKEPKLILIFETEDQRNKYIDDYNIVITSKLAQTWTSRL